MASDASETRATLANDPPAPPTAQNSLPPMPPGAAPPIDLDSILRNAAPPSPHGPPVVRSPRPSAEKVDERCWTFSRQTNARRALGREAQATMYCYINMRNALADLIPVPGHPAAFLARDAAPGSPAASEIGRVRSRREKRIKVVAGDHEVPDYHWRWLDGRYLYIARGREMIARHMLEMTGSTKPDKGEVADELVEEKGPMHGKVKRRLMPGADEERLGAWGTIQRIEERCAKTEAEQMLPGKREEVMLRRAMGFEPDGTERLVSLSNAFSDSLQRFHAHIVRIYSPGLRNLARLPQTFTDGTQTQMLDTVTTRLTDGSAFRLLGRMWESLGSVSAQLEERRKRRGGGSGDPFAGGLGGSQPPLPPVPGGPPGGGGLGRTGSEPEN
ncbi:hypothetical protein JCM10295v2_000447 [Rhodotorula toruloides]